MRRIARARMVKEYLVKRCLYKWLQREIVLVQEGVCLYVTVIDPILCWRCHICM